MEMKENPSNSIAILIGYFIAKESLNKGIKQVVFDRRNKIFHGRIKKLAEAAREKGLNF